VDASNIAVAAANLSSRSLAEALARARALGFEAITFGGNPTDHTPDSPSLDFLWDELDAAGRAKMLAARRAFARAVIHAPFHDLTLVSINRSIERESLRQMLSAVEAAGALELELVTVHAALPSAKLTPAEHRDRLVRALRTLGDAAAAAGTRIGVENWRYPATPDEHVALLDAVAHPAVGATLDVGHIAYWYQRDGVTSLPDAAAVAAYNARLLGFIDRLGERIWHLHVHDVRPADLRDHRTVGSGIIDFAAVCARLDRLGFDGLLLLELAEPDYEQAVRASREHLLRAMGAVAGRQSSVAG